MTWEERCHSLAQTWRLLRSGQHLVIVETPNRLWHTDTHTSLEPFFHWLPDDVAMKYSRYTRRKGYNEAFNGAAAELTGEAKIRFARWGRGISYHDLMLALDVSHPKDIPIVSAMQIYLNRRSPEHFIRNCRSRSYRHFLQRLVPEVNPGFLYEDMYVALRKP